MAITIRPRVKPHQAFTEERAPQSGRMAFIRRVHPASWVILAVALIGFVAFIYQVTLVAQPRNYQPAWYGAEWITAPNSTSSTVYFRRDISLATIPSNAFLTVQTWQTYSLYVNGNYVDSSKNNFFDGSVNLAYTYDLANWLQPGNNTIAVRATNSDQGVAALRAVIGIGYGQAVDLYPSGSTWHVTADAALANPRDPVQSIPDWRSQLYLDAAWPAAVNYHGTTPAGAIEHINPVVYTMPLTSSWILSGSSPDAVFYRSWQAPSHQEVWLRVTSTGNAQIYVNGHLLASQPARVNKGQQTNRLPVNVAFTADIYDITPYVQNGVNAIGVHVSSSEIATPQHDLQPQPAALSLDLLSVNNGVVTQTVTDTSWRASSNPSGNWMTGTGTTDWANADLANATAFSPVPPARFIATSLLAPDLSMSFITILGALLVCGLIGAAGLYALSVPQGSQPDGAAVDRLALAALPAVAMMGLLAVFNQEPLLPRPFPFTGLWLGVLAGLFVGSLAFILISSLLTPRLHRWMQSAHQLRQRLGQRVSLTTVAVVVIAIAAFLMASYNLSYENFWQDEVTSIYAGLGIVHTGLPRLLSGFIYEKAELFSYMLAPIELIFGPNPVATRMLSVFEYVASLVLTFSVGRRFFDRRVGLLAMAIVAASPMALRWSREARMYQQAELLILVVVFLFYLAVQANARPRTIYLSMAAVVAMYLSHEETFIVLPALVIYFLAVKRLSWLRDPHWWTAGLLAISAILLQLYLSIATHPPVIGTDHTQEPLILLDFRNVAYYYKLLFDASLLKNGALPALGVISALALIAAVGALFSHHRPLRFLSLFMVVALGSLCFTFTLTADRYIYPIWPIFALLAAYTTVWSSRHLATFAAARLPVVAGRVLPAVCMALLAGAVLLSQVFPLSNFGLATSRLAGLPYHHIYPDYQAAGAYIQDHWQSGDVLVTISPAIDAAFYAEQPNYMIYRDKALYLFEQNGHITDTPAGTTVLLNQNDLNDMLAHHNRVWMMSLSDYYYPGFNLVFTGQSTYVYLRG